MWAMSQNARKKDKIFNFMQSYKEGVKSRTKESLGTREMKEHDGDYSSES